MATYNLNKMLKGSSLEGSSGAMNDVLQRTFNKFGLEDGVPINTLKNYEEIVAYATKELEIAKDMNKTLELRDKLEVAINKTKQQASSDISKQLKLTNEILEINKDLVDMLSTMVAKQQLSIQYANQTAHASEELSEAIALGNKYLERKHKLTGAILDADEKGATISQKRGLQELKTLLNLTKRKKLQEEITKLEKEEAEAIKKINENLSLSDYEKSLKIQDIKDSYDKKRSNAMEDMNASIKLLPSKMDLLVNSAHLIKKGMDKIHSSIERSIDTAMDDRAKYLGPIDSRLQGFDGKLTGNFNKILDEVTDEIGTSTIVSQRAYLESINKLVSSGYVYNLEQRALLETLNDKLVPTFNALDNTLLRLNRISGVDYTYSQMGAEAQLTQFLNSRYKDTSYLTDEYDNINQTLFDAMSGMDITSATSFMFDVQKWLSSMYTQGVSSQTLQMIAQGLAYLGSGNVSALSSNSALQTLLVSSANQAGLDYSNLLLNGFQGNSVNDLMRAIVSNLQGSYSRSGNNVVGSAWGNILGLNLADLRAMSNLTASDIASIYGTSTTYEGAVNAATEQMNLVGNRTAINTRIENLLNNLLYTGASGFANGNDTDYILYKALGIVGDITGSLGGGSILTKALGAIAGGVQDAMFAAKLFGKSDVSEIWGDLLSVMSPDNARLPAFGMGISNSRGNIFGNNYSTLTSAANGHTHYSGKIPGVYEDVSASTAIGISNSSSEIAAYNLARNAEAVSATSSNVVGSSAVAVRDMQDLYAELFENQSTPIRVKLASFEEEAINALTSTSGYFPVDVRDEDIGSINDAISRLQLVRNDYYYYS